MLAVTVAVAGVFLGGATSSATGERTSPYALRVVTVEGKPVKVLFTSRFAVPVAVGPTRSVVDLSPDRRRAIFDRRIVTGYQSGPTWNEVFYVADVHGRDGRAFVAQRFPDFFDPQASWSPDWLRIAFGAPNLTCSGTYTYWSEAADGTDLRRIGDGVEFAWGPKRGTYAIVESGCWPPPGQGPAPALQLTFVDASGGRHLIATAEAEQLGILPGAISPRGDLIAYETSGCTPDASLRIARTDGGGEITGIRGSSTFAAWAPDGTRFAFLKPRNNGSCGFMDGASEGALGVADSRGLHLRILVRLPAARTFSDPTDPVWAPNGRLIAYTRGSNHGIETV